MELKHGDRVVYPNQGICDVVGIQPLDIGGVRSDFITLVRERDGATVRVPKAKAAEVGIRPIGTAEQAHDALDRLGAITEEPILDWKTRQREHQEMMARGGLAGMAEVLRNLFTLSIIRPLPQREREMYDQVRALVIEEISEVLGLPPVAVEDQIDLALAPPEGRGLAQRRLRARAAERQIEAARQPSRRRQKAPAQAPDAEAPEAAPAKKAPTKKVPSKKPTGKATPKQPAAKKAPAKKPAGKAPAKKAPAKKAPTSKAPAAKKPAKKKAPAAKKPAKKKAPAKPAAKKPAASKAPKKKSSR